jgi:peptidoglycan/xylan/chitin deacetylase (PgdA/CDA1 family)
VLIVAYHAISDAPSPICTSAPGLRADLLALRRAGYEFHALDDCADWLEGKRTMPARSVAVTFDDGYRSVVETALPLLVELGVPATVFVIAGRLGDDNRWPGQWRSVPAMPLMSASDVREAVSAGMTVGAHSWTHAVLPDLPERQLASEIHESGDRLAQVSGTEVRHFAYPYGRRGARERAAAAERYRTAVSATTGLVRPGASALDLPRLDAHDVALARRARLLDPARLRPYLAVRRLLRDVRRRIEPRPSSNRSR